MRDTRRSLKKKKIGVSRRDDVLVGNENDERDDEESKLGRGGEIACCRESRKALRMPRNFCLVREDHEV